MLKTSLHATAKVHRSAIWSESALIGHLAYTTFRPMMQAPVPCSLGSDGACASNPAADPSHSHADVKKVTTRDDGTLELAMGDILGKSGDDSSQPQ